MNIINYIENLKINPKFSLSFNFIKWIAILTMTYDHVLKYIFNLTPACIELFWGRLAFPLFVFMIVYHLIAKQNFLRYILRLLPFALMTLWVHIKYYDTNFLNIMFTFIFSISLIWIFELLKNNPDKKFVVFSYFVIALTIIPISFIFEYRLFGILFFISFFYFAKTKNLLIGLLSICVLVSFMPNLVYSLLIIPFGVILLFLNPAPNKDHGSFYTTGWLFYAYYPLHLYIIALIRNTLPF